MTTVLTKFDSFLQAYFNAPPTSVAAITGDASFRRYFRIEHNGLSYILMAAEPSKVDNRPFVALTEHFAAGGLRVPQVLAVDHAQGLVLLEDFGSVHLADKLNEATRVSHYQQVLALMPKIATLTPSSWMKPYDAAFIAMELDIFRDWLLSQWLQVPSTAELTTRWQALQHWLVGEFIAQPQVTMHRDFHSRNIMAVEDGWALIDYQDAVQGPVCYDVVSLLRDCYFRLPEAEFIQLRHDAFILLHQAGLLAQISETEFAYYLDVTGLQRHLKAAGIFVRLWLRDGKAGYLANILPTLAYIVEVAEKYPQSQWLASWLQADIIPAVSAKLESLA
ncbi:aminoglycoside phosphotransferase family protein [Pseudoalteromonas fenneropenaei]|uniref:Aminoglycoside phosphotransferase family protein n=1 Tax=Pseudoalteromonas fenneropenaei TaxID=1737459 RepID=A0ABV7CLN8_9GAMM